MIEENQSIEFLRIPLATQFSSATTLSRSLVQSVSQDFRYEQQLRPDYP